MSPQEHLERKLRLLFPEEKQRLSAVEILSDYGRKDWQREPERVRLAILKLAGADLDQVRFYAKDACTDYRDILG